MMAKPFNLLLILTLFSCGNSKNIYKQVLNNNEEFNIMVSYLKRNDLLIKKDSLVLKNGSSILSKNICLYNSTKDQYIKDFMLKFDISNICVYSDKPKLIYFTNDAPPYFSTTRVVYDDGNSYLRKNIKDEKSLKIIDSTLIFIDKK